MTFLSWLFGSKVDRNETQKLDEKQEDLTSNVLIIDKNGIENIIDFDLEGINDSKIEEPNNEDPYLSIASLVSPIVPHLDTPYLVASLKKSRTIIPKSALNKNLEKHIPEKITSRKRRPHREQWFRKIKR